MENAIKENVCVIVRGLVRTAQNNFAIIIVIIEGNVILIHSPAPVIKDGLDPSVIMDYLLLVALIVLEHPVLEILVY